MVQLVCEGYTGKQSTLQWEKVLLNCEVHVTGEKNFHLMLIKSLVKVPLHFNSFDSNSCKYFFHLKHPVRYTKQQQEFCWILPGRIASEMKK